VSGLLFYFTTVNVEVAELSSEPDVPVKVIV
jgi:hypothetical protein